MRIYEKRGYGLVVERVLAKDETRVRFPVAAQKTRNAQEERGFDEIYGSYMQKRPNWAVFACLLVIWWTVDKGVSTGDKRHGACMNF